jgi:hypothetical protein
VILKTYVFLGKSQILETGTSYFVQQ